MGSAGGTRLAQFLTELPIETRWISGHHIVWQTGQQSGPNSVGPDDHTHCSALVAAVAALHGSQLTVEDNDPGLRILMNFDAVRACDVDPKHESRPENWQSLRGLAQFPEISKSAREAET